jgi:hypothetical protein
VLASLRQVVSYRRWRWTSPGIDPDRRRHCDGAGRPPGRRRIGAIPENLDVGQIYALTAMVTTGVGLSLVISNWSKY